LSLLPRQLPNTYWGLDRPYGKGSMLARGLREGSNVWAASGAHAVRVTNGNQSRGFGIVALCSLRVREVPGSIPGIPLRVRASKISEDIYGTSLHCEL